MRCTSLLIWTAPMLLAGAAMASDTLPESWTEAVGNPVKVNGAARWRADRVWPDDPKRFDAFVTMPWRDGAWKPTEHEHGGQPRIEVRGGVMSISARSAGGHNNPGLKIPALVYLPPQAGWYGMKGEATTKRFEGYGELTLRLARRGGGRVDTVKEWSLQHGQTQPLEGVAAKVDEGDELVLMLIADRAALDVRIAGLAFGPDLMDERVRAARERFESLPRVAVNSAPTGEELDRANRAVIEAGEGGMVFPADSRVANVKAFGAKGDGKHDDTAAFKAALESQPKNRLIYVPNGTYLITDTLRWGERQTRQILQGQSRDGAIIKLMDGCPGYGDPTQPKAMVWTGNAPAQRFRNGIFNLTFDTGKNNPGAIGVQYIANNSGSVKDVLIRSGDPDGAGVIGLDLGYSNEQGPCLIKRVAVEGFDTGVFTKYAVDGVVAEDLTLRGQRKVGWLNDGQCVSLRGLRSTNAVPAFHNREQASLLALIDSELVGVGDAANQPAIINNRGLFARNLKTTGYRLAIENTDGTKQYAQGPNIDEFVSHEVLTLGDTTDKRSLSLPIAETPEPEWGDPADWVNVATFTAKPVEITRPDGKVVKANDWSTALQQAIDSGARTVYFPHRTQGTITLLSDVIVRGNVERIIGLESEFRGIYGPLDTGHKLSIIARNDKPLVIERWDATYTGIQFRHEGQAPLVLRHLSMNEYNGVTKAAGSGDLFIEDFAFGGGLFIEGGNVWARQYNPEGEALKSKTDNNGGNLWVLGLKTEGDTQLVNTRHGGQTEIVGGFIYANKANDPDKVMFRVDATSAMSFTIGEWVGRKQPFDIIERTDTGARLKFGQAPGRGEGSMVPLFVTRPARPIATPMPPTSP